MAKNPSVRDELLINTEMKLAIARWKVYTGKPIYKLAEELGCDQSYLSRIVSGDRSGEKYLDRLRKITGEAAS